jgi:hypothetical protein
MERFRKALLPAFNPNSMQLLTADYFGPVNTFANLTGNGPFEIRLYELIDQARMEDWLVDLVAAARERRPKNKDIEAIAEDLGLTAAGPRLIKSSNKPLEELIQENAKYITPSVFREKLAELEGQVCRIVIPGGGGTGFLVGPDLVVTNQHVIEPLKTNQANWRDVMCWFDYHEATDGTNLSAKKTTEVKLHPNKWLEHDKAPSQYDWEPTLGDAAVDETDCALIRLAERIGDVPVGGPTTDADATRRGWITANGAVPPVIAGNQVFVLQHPRTEPLQLTVGVVREFNARGTRIRYDANTKDGSSGSPCFDSDLQLIGLHHAYDPGSPPKWNQAVPLSRIQETWQADGVALN